MTAEVFCDTNILVYAAVGSGLEEAKRAIQLIGSEDFATSAPASRSIQDL